VFHLLKGLELLPVRQDDGLYAPPVAASLQSPHAPVSTSLLSHFVRHIQQQSICWPLQGIKTCHFSGDTA